MYMYVDVCLPNSLVSSHPKRRSCETKCLKIRKLGLASFTLPDKNNAVKLHTMQ